MKNEMVIVTGHAGGIGAAITKKMASQGYEVLGIDQRPLEVGECNQIIANLEDIVDGDGGAFEDQLTR